MSQIFLMLQLYHQTLQTVSGSNWSHKHFKCFLRSTGIRLEFNGCIYSCRRWWNSQLTLLCLRMYWIQFNFPGGTNPTKKLWIDMKSFCCCCSNTCPLTTYLMSASKQIGSTRGKLCWFFCFYSEHSNFNFFLSKKKIILPNYYFF